jgi:hypothetical protein
MQSVQMFAHCPQLKAAHDRAACFKTCSILPPFFLSLYHPIQTHGAVGYKKIRQQTLGILVSLVPRLSTLDYRNLNPHSLTISIKPAAPWKGMKLKRMDLPA